MKDGNSFGGAKLPSASLETNVSYLRGIFTGDDTLICRYVTSPFCEEHRFCLVYTDGMVNNKIQNEDVLCPLLQYEFPKDGAPLTEIIAQQVTLSNSVEKTDAIDPIIQGIVYGDTVLLAEGSPDALILNTKGFITRSIAEPDSERVLRGPREGFNESLLVNLSMVRRKLRTPDLKMKFRTFGTRSQTKACICYLGSLADHSVLAELESRLDQIDIDGTLDSQYLAELIRDSPWSPLDTTGSTERPDVIAAFLLEGRIAVFLDGSPVVLTVPHLFIENIQSDEDYYLNYAFVAIGRLLRFLAFFISTGLPAIYVAMATFHQEMLPTPLLISIDTSRQGVPFPTALEMILMLVVFEILRESGARMPGLMGQTLSIVGALVIGQAAVQAKIVSAPIIIVVALTGICGLMIPRMKGFIIIVRLVLLLFTCILGLYGFLLGALGTMAVMYHTTSFGVPIMSDIYPHGLQDLKDIYVRIPWKKMLIRPRFLSKDRVRQSSGGEKK